MGFAEPDVNQLAHHLVRTSTEDKPVPGLFRHVSSMAWNA
jgi:hypothetical protein